MKNIKIELPDEINASEIIAKLATLMQDMSIKSTITEEKKRTFDLFDVYLDENYIRDAQRFVPSEGMTSEEFENADIFDIEYEDNWEDFGESIYLGKFEAESKEAAIKQASMLYNYHPFTLFANHANCS